MKKLVCFLLPMSILACSQLPVNTTNDTQTAKTTTLDSNTLTAYAWQLVKATDDQGVTIDALILPKEKPITVNFSGNALHISNTCNSMNGRFNLKEHALTISPLASTMKMCQDQLNKADKAVSNNLNGTLTAQLQSNAHNPVLTLSTIQQNTLTFMGVPTPETRYGSAADIIFLEIAPQTASCDAGAMKKQCLQSKEISYNEQGIKTNVPANWSNFYDSIQGYQHNPQLRQILRVKRFSISNPPADSSKYAYILDMVVESEIVK